MKGEERKMPVKGMSRHRPTAAYFEVYFAVAVFIALFLLVVPFVHFRPFSPKGGAYLALIGDMELGIHSHGLMGKSNVMFEAFGNLQLLGMMAV